MGTKQYILTFNAGSSSLKTAVFKFLADNLTEVASASIENIGQDSCVLISRRGEDAAPARPVSAADHPAAAARLITWLKDFLGDTAPLAVGHRQVHGGRKFQAPTLLTPTVIEELSSLKQLDPDHLPFALKTIQAALAAFPDSPQVVCFDTAFYKDLPRRAQIMPLPRRLEALGVKRYGFHGLSYQFLLDDFARHEGEVAANGRVIMAHLGSGASLCAVGNGRPVDMTMGFTPSSGIPMSTRSGDLDPGVALFAMTELQLSPAEFNRMVNKESGLLGVSGLSPDMLTLLNAQADNPNAAEAVELFCYRAAQAAAGLAASLGGLDSLIFSGGIGSRSAEVRRRICENLGFIGVQLDDQRNQANQRLISRDGAAVGVHVIITNEELVLAKQTIGVIKGDD